MSTSPQTRTVAASLRALLEGLIDYAGLFPPAAFDMRRAVSNYASYLQGEYRWALGRFVVPVARLKEFQAAQHSLLNPETIANIANLVGIPTMPAASVRYTFPWRLSAIVANDAELVNITEFNSEHAGRAIIDSLEVKAASIDDVRRIRPLVPAGVIPYFEIPWDSRPELFQMMKSVDARAKIRTGGLVESAFPPAEAIAQFIVRCAEAECAFKATAGLHHPVRCVKPLTYEAQAPTGKMHGFLNLFLPACLIGGARKELQGTNREHLIGGLGAILANEVPENFFFGDDEAVMRGTANGASGAPTRETNYEFSVSTNVIRNSRAHFAIAFGSCSFEEPIEDLRSLNLL